jgi:hypothetical protein
MGLAQAGAAVEQQRVVGAPGFCATCIAAALPSWLDLPSTNVSKV